MSVARRWNIGPKAKSCKKEGSVEGGVCVPSSSLRLSHFRFAQSYQPEFYPAGEEVAELSRLNGINS